MKEYTIESEEKWDNKVGVVQKEVTVDFRAEVWEKQNHFHL